MAKLSITKKELNDFEMSIARGYFMLSELIFATPTIIRICKDQYNQKTELHQTEQNSIITPNQRENKTFYEKNSRGIGEEIGQLVGTALGILTMTYIITPNPELFGIPLITNALSLVYELDRSSGKKEQQRSKNKEISDIVDNSVPKTSL